jgi:hypothetical protein
MHNWVVLIKKNVIYQFTIFCCGKNLGTFLCTYKCFYLLYKDESVCVVVCVCMSAACRRTYTTYHPKIWSGLLISPGLGTEPGGDRKCWPLGVPLIVTPSEKPWRVNNWVGASKQKLLLRVGLNIKMLFVGAHPNPKPAGFLDQCAQRAAPGGPASWQ